jgi:hypothetical protein
MSAGTIARKLLGARFQPVGELYRSIFVDVDKIARFWAGHLPAGARCIEIGGGDGMMANALLRRRPDLSITMADVAQSVGAFLEERFAARTHVRPRTTVADLARETPRAEAIIIADVVHHVPAGGRESFFSDVRALCRASGCELLLIKDVEPGTLRGVLSLLSDRYVTGDREVSLLSTAEMVELVERALGGMLGELSTATPDAANYCIVANLKPEGERAPEPVARGSGQV